MAVLAAREDRTVNNHALAVLQMRGMAFGARDLLVRPLQLETRIAVVIEPARGLERFGVMAHRAVVTTRSAHELNAVRALVAVDALRLLHRHRQRCLGDIRKQQNSLGGRALQIGVAL